MYKQDARNILKNTITDQQPDGLTRTLSAEFGRQVTGATPSDVQNRSYGSDGYYFKFTTHNCKMSLFFYTKSLIISSTQSLNIAKLSLIVMQLT